MTTTSSVRCFVTTHLSENLSVPVGVGTFAERLAPPVAPASSGLFPQPVSMSRRDSTLSPLACQQKSSVNGDFPRNLGPAEFGLEGIGPRRRLFGSRGVPSWIKLPGYSAPGCRTKLLLVFFDPCYFLCSSTHFL